ncbi:hypothetical protein DW253_12095 [Ruminococcus sp. AM22-13]|nr:hypothetical protein DW253_12095 [Ruminococcus sp. AM22-13]
MNKIPNIIDNLPPMLSGKELISALSVLPEYDSEIVNASAAERLMALSDIYRIYIPSKMSQEIYSKFYLALMRSLQKKCINTARQQRENFKVIQHKSSYNGGIIGGSDSFSIIGNSGIGKSASIFRSIQLLRGNKVIEMKNPYAKIIPILVVQTPFDSSTKGLMLEILRKIDELLGSKYYENAIRSKATTDSLIGCVSQIALNNIGLLVLDEIQNICHSKNGRNLVGSITQLVNNSGISICFVGTPECKDFFAKAMHLARRTMGLQYGSMEYGTEFIAFCKIIFQYQYMEKHVEITERIIEWLYEHSNGNASIVISILHDAQEIGILSSEKELTLGLLEKAYNNRMEVLHNYVEFSMIRKSTKRKKNEQQPNDELLLSDSVKIADIVVEAKESGENIVTLLKKNLTVVEVRV